MRSMDQSNLSQIRVNALSARSLILSGMTFNMLYSKCITVSAFSDKYITAVSYAAMLIHAAHEVCICFITLTFTSLVK